MAQLWPVIDAMEWCISRDIYTTGPICERYMNSPKGQNVEGLVFFLGRGGGNRSLHRRGVEVPVYSLFLGKFIGAEFFTSRNYICVVEEVPEEFIFGLTESPACERAGMKLINGFVVREPN